MKTPFEVLRVAVVLIAAMLLSRAVGHAQGTAFIYSGSLSESNAFANGTYEFRFELFGQASGGAVVGGPLTNSPVTVSNGLFSVQLDFGAAPFDGGDRWLEVAVRKINAGAFSPLSPRQQLTALPYAITASKVTGPLPTSGLSGAYTNPVTLNNPANVFAGDGSALTGISSTMLGGLSAGDFWQRGGNAGTTPGTHFLGTADNQALELKVNQARALRLEPGAGGVPNLIVGAAGNTIDPGVVGATIAGGQDHAIRNNAAHAFIGGGRNNKIETNSAKAVIAGGEGNLIDANADHATIGGGQANGVFASSRFAVVAGGTGNLIFTNSNFGTVGGGSGNQLDAFSQYSTIAGGQSGYIQGANWSAIGGGRQQKIRASANSTIAGGGYNEIGTNASYATVGGGYFNRVQTNAAFGVVGGGRESKVTGEYGMVPGGHLNEAAAYSFAAGRQAKATNSGAFVWADSTGVDFGSTTNNQFSVRASGGVRFVTGGAGVTVDGQPLGGAGAGDGSALTNLNASALASGTVADARLSANVARLDQAATFSGDLATAEDLIGKRLNVGADHLLLGNMATIAGGENNTNQAAWAVIDGGLRNTVKSSANFAVIGGGNDNVIGISALNATVAGGADNSIGLNAQMSTIGGGFINAIGDASQRATIAGGSQNTIHSNSIAATIGGGYYNEINSSSPRTTIAGGQNNDIGRDSDGTTISGGVGNGVGDSAAMSTIAGGSNNVVGATFSTIGGGSDNTNQAAWAVIDGGLRNTVKSSANFAVIGGGNDNAIGISALNATVAGGADNSIGLNAQMSTIGGGFINAIGDASQRATIAGGSQNTIHSNSIAATIGGGYYNEIQTNAGYATIGGGYQNMIQNNGFSATIPGGLANTATNHAFAAGTRAKANHTGAFVWGDSTDADIASVANNSVTFRAAGGYRLFSDSGATAGVSLAPGGTSWAVISDRNLKKDFAPVDGVAVLEKLAALPITQWRYAWEAAETTPHLGPMAQDFKAAFYPGADDKVITTQEADGVALAAIQGLNAKVESGKQKAERDLAELRQQLNRRDAENVELRQELQELKQLVRTLTHRLEAGAL